MSYVRLFFSLCSATLIISVSSSANVSTTPNNTAVEDHLNLGKRNPMAIAGLVVSVISTIITLVTSTIGLAQPSETDLRLDKVIATLDKIDSTLSRLDSTLMDVFDVQDVKQLRTKVVGMKDKFKIYVENPDDTDSKNEYIRSCKKNDPQSIVTLLHDAQLGDKLFGGKKLSDFCIMYRSKDLYQYAVSPYATARRLVLYAQEAALKETFCMAARNVSNYLMNASATLMLSKIRELNQSLDADLRMEETTVRYAIRQDTKCLGSHSDIAGTYYSRYYDCCTTDRFEEQYQWKFEFAEIVAPPTTISNDYLKSKPVYCTKELKHTTTQLLKYYDVKDVPRFAAGNAQFNNQTAFLMRSLYKKKIANSFFRAGRAWNCGQLFPDRWCTNGCDTMCSLFNDKDTAATFNPLQNLFKIIRNPRENTGAITFTIADYWSPKRILGWHGSPCDCGRFDTNRDDRRKWTMFGMDTAGKVTPLS